MCAYQLFDFAEIPALSLLSQPVRLWTGCEKHLVTYSDLYAETVKLNCNTAGPMNEARYTTFSHSVISTQTQYHHISKIYYIKYSLRCAVQCSLADKYIKLVERWTVNLSYINVRCVALLTNVHTLKHNNIFLCKI